MTFRGGGHHELVVVSPTVLVGVEVVAFGREVVICVLSFGFPMLLVLAGVA